jgi:hypothetical protein
MLFYNRTGIILSISVPSEIRGQGIGKNLILTAIKITRILGGKYLEAMVTHQHLITIFVSVFGENCFGIPLNEAQRRLVSSNGVKLAVSL